MSYQPGDMAFVREIDVAATADMAFYPFRSSLPHIVSGLATYQTSEGLRGHAMGVVIEALSHDRYRIEVDRDYRKVQYIVYGSQMNKV